MQTSKSGASYTRLSVSTHRSRKLENGTWDTSTEWHKVTVWGRPAESCVKNLAKGAPLAVEGYLESYKLEREDGPVTQVAIVAHQIHFLPNPKQQSMRLAEDEAFLGLGDAPSVSISA